MIIVEDDLSGPEIRALLRDHVQGMINTSPPDSVHSLSIDDLRASAITMWSAWEGSELLGCGARGYREDPFSRFMVLALRND